MNTNKNSSKKRIFFLLFTVVTLSIISIGLLWLYNNSYQITLYPEKFTESTALLSNPDRGWYNIYGYILSEENPYTEEYIDKSMSADKDSRLALLEVNLLQYRSSKISDKALSQLNFILNTWKKTNKHIILRFLYDWDGKSSQTEPSNLSTILTHMSQLATIVNSHKDQLYTLQGIFIGDVGEMHGSKFNDIKSSKILINHLAKVIDPSIYLAVRTPAFWRQFTGMYQPISFQLSSTPPLDARLGLFNDGILGSDYDLGTYGEKSMQVSKSLSDKFKRSDELLFQNNLCNFVPNGGEVVINNPLNDLANAASTLGTMHVSYLNSGYDQNVLNKWKSTIYKGPNLFNGHNGYEYITKHLGYRFSISEASVSYRTLRDKSMTITIKINNSGFSTSYKSYKSVITLENESTGEINKYDVNSDPRRWLPNTNSDVFVSIPVNVHSLGKYKVYFSITNPIDQENITLANTNTPTKNGYYLGKILVEKFPTIKFAPALQLAN